MFLREELLQPGCAKRQVYKVCVVSVLLYGSETWVLTEEMSARLVRREGPRALGASARRIAAYAALCQAEARGRDRWALCAQHAGGLLRVVAWLGLAPDPQLNSGLARLTEWEIGTPGRGSAGPALPSGRSCRNYYLVLSTPRVRVVSEDPNTHYASGPVSAPAN